MRYEYSDRILEVIRKAEEVNAEALEKLISEMVRTVREDRIIHTFGTGHSHMIGIEIFSRAGTLGNVSAILDYDTITSQGARRSSLMERVPGISDIIFDIYEIKKGDILIISSNSGRNAMPVEMAMRAQKEGIFTVALTNLKQSMETTSRHPSGKKLYEFADLILDNCCPEGDCMLDAGGIKTGPATSISGMFLLNIAMTETIRRCVEEGLNPPVFQSQNVDGYDNDAIYEKYIHRVRHL